ncbi:MAG TPA: acetyl-CoA carboxylase carboxyltransferase subunit alpha [Bacteroidia bacterium]
MVYLDFEEPIKLLQEQLDKTREIGESSGVDTSKSIKELEKTIAKTRKEIYSKLTAWQKVQVSRHPDRPYTLAYMNALSDGTFVELHGDRNVKDDKAMVGGIAKMDGKPVMFIGQQKGINAKMRILRNFGMANPEGYRKALRLMKLADKFNIPIVCFVDTPGAYPGLEAEERGQGEAIARNIYEMFRIKVPIVVVIIGEGASGGALGIGVGDRVAMMQYTWYSVISPESCSSILFRTWDEKERAAEALKLTSSDMLKNKLIDSVIPEPLGGAHTNHDEAFANVKEYVVKTLAELEKIKPEKRIQNRIKKFESMGVFND